MIPNMMNFGMPQLSMPVAGDQLKSVTQAKLVAAQNAISNANQSQYLLGQLGRFVAWTGEGSATPAGN
jgi:hypothetical protein